MFSITHFLAAPIIGEGYIFGKDGQKMPTKEAYEIYGLKPFELKFKEGLALINGTSGMTGLGCMVLAEAKVQVKQAEIIAALVLENQNASDGAFMDEGHRLGKPHDGEIDCAENLRKLLDGSELISTHKKVKIEVENSKKSGETCKFVFFKR